MKYLDLVGGALGFNVVKGSRIVCWKNPDTAHGLFDSDYYYPTNLGPLKAAAGAAFDRIAARSSKRRARR